MGKDRQPFIGIFGRRNNGKSTLINRLAAQEIAIVSDTPGTTTDPVKKSFEITGFGPVVLVDTAGTDDIGELGEKRVSKTLKAIDLVDLAILITTNNHLEEPEQKLIEEFKRRDVPFLIIHNKEDISQSSSKSEERAIDAGAKGFLKFSHKYSIEPVIEAIQKAIPESAFTTPTLLGDLIKHGDIVLLITPIDIEAPAGRMILPQVQTIRDVLDNDAICIVLKERETDAFIERTGIKPALAVTDSQVFPKADASIPGNIPLTSFSILLARLKGNFENYLQGTPSISKLTDGDRVLMLESCTHHVSCDDIGRVKIPRWIRAFTGKKLDFDIVAGLDTITRPITDYSLIIQCGGCMITRRQLHNRLQPAIEAGIPVTNYGMAIAWVHGIYHRAVAPFRKDLQSEEETI
ncbi:[FeFe] hydrogenase H-cluster maturation GTPase HydF [Marinilabilia rubra]|uniref:[FeFe] hydrogenase H-cluster maturation GTPase HydF n=1 Tax=Marinilabilia rubra TaxID=2162893 RepID=A0A2U2BDQ7_9BACT|nr:[FeFe] hydrogenase H-cluster maturation GTPase HydF [Marinilabilia rubra]PWE01205.1 [FeFe] hydrogenase H-cluster maturation GTPase HydF [Marinilabilia rubra]